MKKIFLILTLFIVALQANELDDLLVKLKQESIALQNQSKQKEAKFLAEKNTQAQKIANLKAQIAKFQNSVDLKEKKSEENDAKLTSLQEELSSKSVNLEELFATAKQSSKELYALAKNSLLRTQYPLDKGFIDLVNSNKLPNAKELELLWSSYLKEIVNQGKISKYNAKVISKEGVENETQITRIGGFTAFKDGEFLKFNEETNTLSTYQKQPESYLSYAKDISPNSGIVNILIDPTKGSLLNIQSLKPNLTDRLNQAGGVGYVIILLGIFGIILAIYQIFRLFAMSGRIKSQIKDLSNLKQNNPLGRVLLYVQDETNSDAFEAKLSQAVLREMPKIDRIKDFIKLLAGVAPMLGLLGTVIGMIATFQAITLFGTGEPKLMAGGISQALITTVLGLVVAIPLLFLYSILNSKSQTILQIIYEQSAGLLSKKVKQ